jgi:hypothetical protein
MKFTAGKQLLTVIEGEPRLDGGVIVDPSGAALSGHPPVGLDFPQPIMRIREDAKRRNIIRVISFVVRVVSLIVQTSIFFKFCTLNANALVANNLPLF